MTRTLAVVTAGLSQPSSTRLLADRLAAATDRALRLEDQRAEIEVVELRPLARDLADHLLTGFPSPALAEALALVARADAVIAVTPVFSASYSGLFKSFFDLVEPDALAGTPVLLGATAGTARHSLVIEHAMRPLFTYLHALTVPTGVFAASEDFGSAHAGAETETGGTALAERVERAARELVALLEGRRTAPRSADAPDPFENPTPFEELLRP
jgi:FMN reductase